MDYWENKRVCKTSGRNNRESGVCGAGMDLRCIWKACKDHTIISKSRFMYLVPDDSVTNN